MTRDQIILLAGRQLGEESADFLGVVGSFFDQVLLDLAQSECVEQLKSEVPFDLVADQESYSTRTITGLAAPYYPMRILRLWVPTWGVQGVAPFFRPVSFQEFLVFRQSGAAARGRFQVWSVYPSLASIRVWPPVAAEDAGVGLGSVEFLRPPATIAGGTELEDIHIEDIPTIVRGLVFYGAPFRDETLLDVDRSGALYQQGKRTMWGRTHNGEPGRTEPHDF